MVKILYLAAIFTNRNTLKINTYLYKYAKIYSKT